MDPQLDRTIFANAPSPLFCRDKYVGNLLQDKPAMIERTPSPLFVDDSYVGNVDSRAVQPGLECPPASRTSSQSRFDGLTSPKNSHTLNGQVLSSQELDSTVSTQTDEDQDDSYSQVDRELGTPDSQILSDEDLGGFVVPDDSGSEAASDTSRPQRSTFSGLVNQQKIGKTVKSSPTKKSPVKKTARSKKKDQRNMLKELLPFNEDVVKPTRDGISKPWIDISKIKLTRAELRAFQKAGQDKPLSPRKTYNEKALMGEQMQKIRGHKGFFPTNKTTRKSCRLSNGNTGNSQEPRKDSGPKASHEVIIEIQAQMALDAWNAWDVRKGHITSLLSKPRYTVSATAHNPEAVALAPTPVYVPGGRIPDDFNLSMENGLYVFSPTATVFKEFATFLGVVEEIAGREQGVVKVIVPKECLRPRNRPSYASSNQADLKELTTYSPNLHLHKSRSTTTVAYDVLMPSTEHLAAAAWRKSIQMKRGELQKDLGPNAVGIEDVWKEARVVDGYTEEAMIKDNERYANEIFYAPDVAATDDLRDTLRCGNPELGAYQGNSLLKSRSVKAGINTSVFQVSSTDGTMFGMRIADFGAYLLNYLHDGAPQIWTVVKPTQHKRLEETLHGFLQLPKTGEEMTGIAIPRPKLTPPCDNFLRHKQLYVPEETLQSYEIEHTKVVQYLGEMIITFPFAYHQAYNTGANIAESMAYASDRWEIFPSRKLLQQCSRDCSPKVVRPLFNLDFISSFPPNHLESSPDPCCSSTTSPMPEPSPSSAPSASKKGHSDKRLSSKRGKADWENDDGPVSPQGARRWRSKRAKTKTTYQASDSDDTKVKLLKHKI